MIMSYLVKIVIIALWGALFFVPEKNVNFTAFLSRYATKAAPEKPIVIAPPAPPVFVGNENAPVIKASAYLLMDARSGATLAVSSSTATAPIASLTKLMTALLMAERGFDGNGVIEIFADDRVGGNVEYFLPGDKIKFKDLLAASLIASSNTATNIIARVSGGEKFVTLMNERARMMNLSGSSFSDPTGLDPENVSTVYDIARIASRAFGRPEISEILLQQNYQITVVNTGRKISLRNTDELLGSDLDRGEYKILGGKTGFINESGYNLAFRVGRGGNEVLIVILGSESKAARFAEAKKLAFWAFENFRWPEK